MPFPNKLRGKEQEILRKRRDGRTEYQLAVEYGVYPNAIRALVKRETVRAARAAKAG